MSLDQNPSAGEMPPQLPINESEQQPSLEGRAVARLHEQIAPLLQAAGSNIVRLAVTLGEQTASNTPIMQIGRHTPRGLLPVALAAGRRLVRGMRRQSDEPAAVRQHRDHGFSEPPVYRIGLPPSQDTPGMRTWLTLSAPDPGSNRLARITGETFIHEPSSGRYFTFPLERTELQTTLEACMMYVAAGTVTTREERRPDSELDPQQRVVGGEVSMPVASIENVLSERMRHSPSSLNRQTAVGAGGPAFFDIRGVGERDGPMISSVNIWPNANPQHPNAIIAEVRFSDIWPMLVRLDMPYRQRLGFRDERPWPMSGEPMASFYCRSTEPGAEDTYRPVTVDPPTRLKIYDAIKAQVTAARVSFSTL